MYHSPATLLTTLASGLLAATTLPAQYQHFTEQVIPGYPTKVVAHGDLDRDGDQDVVLAVIAGVQVLTNDGTGNFSDALYSLPTGVNALVVGDVDGDRDLDIFAATGNERYLLRNQGAAGFGIELLASPAGPAITASLVDLDGDGDLDLIRTEIFSPLITALNDGSGTFVDAPIFPATTGGLITQIHTADFNEDGRPDVLAMQGATANELLLSSPSGYTNASNTLPLPAAGRAAVGDFDGDHHIDIAYSSSGTSGVYLGDGAGGFRPAGLPFPQVSLIGFAVADFDEDGDLDLAAVDNEFQNSQPVFLYFNEGNGGFTDETASRFSLAPGLGNSIVAADFDGDRDIDIYVGASLLGLLADDDRLLSNRHVHVAVTDTVAAGGMLRVECSRQPGYGTGLGIGLIVFGAESFRPAPTPFGAVHVDAVSNVSLPFVSLPGAAGVAQIHDPVPADPNLIGLEFVFQALIVDVLGQQHPRLTNFQRVVVQ